MTLYYFGRNGGIPCGLLTAEHFSVLRERRRGHPYNYPVSLHHPFALLLNFLHRCFKCIFGGDQTSHLPFRPHVFITSAGKFFFSLPSITGHPIRSRLNVDQKSRSLLVGIKFLHPLLFWLTRGLRFVSSFFLRLKLMVEALSWSTLLYIELH